MLSLIIPCYNEEGAIEDIVKRCDAVLKDEDEIIVVNDGSTDRTAEILENINIDRLKVVSHKKNTGNGASIMTGLSNARGEWIATIDADGTYFPEEIPKLYQLALSGDADIVTGLRESLMQGPFLHSRARNILRRLTELASGQKVADVNSGLKIVRKEVIERYRKYIPKRFSPHIVMTICAGRDRCNIQYVPIQYGPRIGSSKLSSGIRGPANFIKFILLIFSTWIRKPKKPIKQP